MAVVITESGREVIAAFLAECKAQRKDILDARLDTADDTNIPTVEDIISDIEWDCVYEDGKVEDYLNCWGITDHHDSDTLELRHQVEFVVEKE